MKGTLWTVIILFTLILGMGIASAVISANITSDFTKDLKQAEEYIRSENWTEARSTVENMNARWEETCNWLQFWVNHADTDDVNLGLATLTSALEMEDKGQSLLSAAELNESLRHIYHRDALSIGNIL